MDTKDLKLKLKKPQQPSDDNNNKKSDAQPINDDNNRRHSRGPDLLWEEIK